MSMVHWRRGYVWWPVLFLQEEDCVLLGIWVVKDAMGSCSVPVKVALKDCNCCYFVLFGAVQVLRRCHWMKRGWVLARISLILSCSMCLCGQSRCHASCPPVQMAQHLSAAVHSFVVCWSDAQLPHWCFLLHVLAWCPYSWQLKHWVRYNCRAYFSALCICELTLNPLVIHLSAAWGSVVKTTMEWCAPSLTVFCWRGNMRVISMMFAASRSTFISSRLS